MTDSSTTTLPNSQSMIINMKRSRLNADEKVVGEYLDKLDKLKGVIDSIVNSIIPAHCKLIEQERTNSPDRIVYKSAALANDQYIQNLPDLIRTQMLAVCKAYNQMRNF